MDDLLKWDKRKYREEFGVPSISRNEGFSASMHVNEIEISEASLFWKFCDEVSARRTPRVLISDAKVVQITDL